MFRQLKRTLVATLIAALTAGQAAPVFADSADSLPDMGTSAGSTLSIGQEMQMGRLLCAPAARQRAVD
ncbi:UNVERIFIED_ORG: putative Zn-dependent protease [Atlantibacter sp. SORGH_AS 304]|nr:putative Zn-dependent protease [Atlantibacter sp. SORGH_AS_0304]